MKNVHDSLDKQNSESRALIPKLQENGNINFGCTHSLYPCDKCRKLFPLGMLTKVSKKFHRKKSMN